MSETIGLIRGDGIGPEVTAAAVRVIEAAGVKVDWVDLPAGGSALDEYGHPLPERTTAAILGHKLCLKGPVATPIGEGFTSVNVTLRRRLGLYAAVRPVRSLPGIKSRYEDVDLVVIRENTEGLYSGIEHEVVSGVVESLKVATLSACTRIARWAFDYAESRGRRKVTVFHKANIMKMSDGLFLRAARRIREAFYPGIEYEELIIDNGCMQLVADPSRFDVLLMENLYGDLVSDLCSGLVGGLGVVPGGNIGADCAVFEAVHGTAPDIAGKGIANLLACIMSGVMMLNHMGEASAAERIRAAYDTVLTQGDPAHLTPDIGGRGTTDSFTQAIVDVLS